MAVLPSDTPADHEGEVDKTLPSLETDTEALE